MSDSRRLVIRFELTEVPEWVFDPHGSRGFLCVGQPADRHVGQIARLTKLKTLDIAHNAIESVPSLGELPNLSDYLYLSDNKLTAFPEPVARLANLRYLGLTDNRIAALPGDGRGLTSLVELRLYSNGDVIVAGIAWRAVASARAPRCQ